MQGSNPKHAMYPMGTGVMYHVSPRKNRENILSQGLRGHERQWLDTPWNYGVDQPHGNYLFDNPEDAKGYAYTLRGQQANADDWTKEPDWEEQYTHDYPDNFDDLSDDEKDTWYDENDPVERKDDPKGYDIYAVNAHGLPLAPDPESRLHHGPEDLGGIYDKYKKRHDELGWTQDWLETTPNELHHEVGDYYGNEPKRYYVPAGITPDRLQLHEHMPSWDMTMGGYYDHIENEGDQSVPSPWMQTPMTEWPQPGHDPRLGKLTRQSMPAVLYHSAPAAARQQIMQQGILPKQELQPHQPFYYPGDEHVWTFNDPDTAAWWAKGDRGGNNDVWRIDAQALPQSAIDYGAAKDHGTFLHGRVPPGAIELHYPAENLPSTQPAWATTSTREFSPLSYTGEENSTELDAKQSAYDPARDPDDAMHDELYSGWSSAHDYDPRWDYSDELRPHWQTHPLAQQAQQMLNGLGEHGRVYAADLSQYGAVGMYIQGTQGEPVILFDPKAHEGYEDQVGQTISHEVRHAQQEREGMSFDEDDAEEGHRNTKTAAAMHPKHHTTAQDHERGKQRYGLPKPHKKRKIVLFPKRRKGAVDPQWLQQWIETNGPWLYHSCDSDVRDKILKEGLVPHDRGPGSKYMGALVPRDNSVYVRAIPHNRFVADNSAMHGRRVAIDLRKLDPSRIQADEDAWSEPVDHRKIGIPRTVDRRGPDGGLILKDIEGNQFPHWGAWADHWQLSQPGQTAHSLNSLKTASVYGGIDPSALRASEDVPFDEQPGYDLETPIVRPIPAEPERVMAAPPYPTRKVPCSHCQGKGEVTEQYDQWEEPWQRPCPECQGDGYLVNALTAKHAMAQSTGDPQLDQLLAQFAQAHRQWQEHDDALGACNDAVEEFVGFCLEHGIHAYGTESTRAEENFGPDITNTEWVGYHDRPGGKGESGHEVAIVEHNGQTFMVDWTAAQYGYGEFPMVQRLDGGGWQRNFSTASCGREGTDNRFDQGYGERGNEGLQVERQKIPVYNLPELGPVRQGKMAAMTRTQLLEMAQQLGAQHGIPDQSEVVHEWPDGWTVKRLKTFGDLNREGELMSNCWRQSFENDDGDPYVLWHSFDGDYSAPLGYTNSLDGQFYPDGSHYSLRDSDNIPHVSVGGDYDDIGGRHNGMVKPEYYSRLSQWNPSRFPDEGFVVGGSASELTSTELTSTAQVTGTTAYQAPTTHARKHSLTPCSSAQHPIERLLGPDAYLSPVSFSPLPHQAACDKVDTRSLARVYRQESDDSEGRAQSYAYSAWAHDGQGSEKAPHSTSYSSYEDSDTPWLEHSDQHAGSSADGVDVYTEGPMSEDLKGIPYEQMFDRGTLNRAQSFSQGDSGSAQSFSMGPLWMEHAAGDSLWIPAEENPGVLYHHAPADLRQSIQGQGLSDQYAQDFPGISLTTNPQGNGDVWAVNTQGLNLHHDPATPQGGEEEEYAVHPPQGERWFFVPGSIPPERLERCGSLSSGSPFEDSPYRLASEPEPHILHYMPDPSDEPDEYGDFAHEPDEYRHDLDLHDSEYPVVEQAIDYLHDQGMTEPSSSQFHPGVWYGHSDEYGQSAHLNGLLPEQEAQVYHGLKARDQMRRLRYYQGDPTDHLPQHPDPWMDNEPGSLTLPEHWGKLASYAGTDDDGLEALSKTSGKLHDFLMNPKSRPDMQTPEGQAFLKTLNDRYWNEKTDPLMPWLAREWKKGRIYHKPETNAIGYDEDPNSVLDFRRAITPERLNHWADFYGSNHPMRQQLGDIMKSQVSIPATWRHHHTGEIYQGPRDHPADERLPDPQVGHFPNMVNQWDEAMKQEAHEQALANGEVVHQYPDGWSLQQLKDEAALKAEGEAMGHCVGGYGDAVRSGRSMIYSLRDPKGSPHVTMEMAPTKHDPDFSPEALAKDQFWSAVPQRLQQSILEHHQGIPPEQWTYQDYPAYDEAPEPSYSLPGSTERGRTGVIPAYEAWKERVPQIAYPENASIVQIQGKGNEIPDPKYQAYLKQYFQSFPEETRPNWESSGLDEVSRLHHLGLTHSFRKARDDYYDEGGYGEHGDYGLADNRSIDWPSLFEDNLRHSGHGYGDGNHWESDNVKPMWEYAKQRGDTAGFAQGAQDFQQGQQDNFDEWMEMNHEYAPRYPDPDEPDGEDEEGKRYWIPNPADGEHFYDPAEAEKAYDNAYDSWYQEHAGMQGASELYGVINDQMDWHPETGYTLKPPPYTFSSWGLESEELYSPYWKIAEELSASSPPAPPAWLASPTEAG